MSRSPFCRAINTAMKIAAKSTFALVWPLRHMRCLELKPEGGIVTAAAYVRFVHPDVKVFNRFALAAAVLAALAWFPAPQIGDELSLLFEPLCAAAVTPPDDSRSIGRSVPVSSEALPNVPGKRLTIVRVSYAPGGYTPPHRHAGSVMA